MKAKKCNHEFVYFDTQILIETETKGWKSWLPIKSGIPVRIWVCDKCGFLEIYHKTYGSERK